MTPRLSLLGEPPAPREVAAEQIEWLRERIRLFARDQAVLVVMARFNAEQAEDQVGLAADGWAEQIKAPDAVTRSAVIAEWQDAQEKVERCAEAMHRRVYVLGREHAAGVEIIAAAQAVCRSHGVSLPTSLLIERVRAIAREASRPRRRSYAA